MRRIAQPQTVPQRRNGTDTHVIRLYQYAPAFGLPNASPFCMKLETYLRMAQLPFVAPQISLARNRPRTQRQVALRTAMATLCWPTPPSSSIT
jgi:hypothetical protein